MNRVVVVGCGVVGAAIAYELSRHPHFTVTLLDQQPPGQGATGSALGIAMGVISQKAKGRNWRLRAASLRRYTTLLPELAAIGHPVPHNAQGILTLCWDLTAIPRWESLQTIRQQQGWQLELWSPAQIADHCPHLDLSNVVVGIYSPQDLQVAPKALTQALVAAAKQQGVICRFDAPVSGFRQTGDRVLAVQTTHTEYLTDWVILAAGLGSSRLTERLGNTIPLVPVLGQGIRVKVPETIGLEDFQPVINGDDIHLVPLGNCEYGVAATVEFPAQEEILPEPEAEALAKVWQGAIAFCPVLKTATTLETWYGLRPRPASQAAPIIQPLSPDSNVVLATGHYRNGVLLAPTTAEAVCQYLLKNP